jgi:regulator of protease activity HflC (stomatin/prohibitin superfamily)
MLDRLIDLIVSLWDNCKPILFIIAYKKGVMFRGGKYLKSLEPGWYFRIPFVDDYHDEFVMFDTMCTEVVNITTADGKTVSIAGEFDLVITDIYKALVLTNDWRTNLMDITRGIISDCLEERNWEEICKKTTKNAIEKHIQKRAEEMGVSISNFNFTDKSISRTYKLFTNGKTQ